MLKELLDLLYKDFKRIFLKEDTEKPENTMKVSIKKYKT
jgi:hypothetical protein